MMEEQLAQMQIDAVTEDESVNLGCEGANVLDYGYYVVGIYFRRRYLKVLHD